jgi:hypothetical protein
MALYILYDDAYCSEFHWTLSLLATGATDYHTSKWQGPKSKKAILRCKGETQSKVQCQQALIMQTALSVCDPVLSSCHHWGAALLLGSK